MPRRGGGGSSYGGGSNSDAAADAINKQQINDLKEKVRTVQDQMEEAGETLEKKLPNEWIIIKANQLLKVQDAVHEIQEKYKAEGMEIKHPVEASPDGLGYIGSLIERAVFTQTEIGGLKQAIGEIDRKLPKYLKAKEKEAETSQAVPKDGDNKPTAAMLVKQGELAKTLEDGYKETAVVLVRPEQSEGKVHG